MSEAYCTVGDVRRALREADLPGDAVQDRQIVRDAIIGQTARVRSLTGKHFYVAGGLASDPDDLVPTDPKTRGPEEQDIPSTPHPQHDVLFDRDRGRYPHATNGRYVRVQLDREDADRLQTLDVRQADGTYDDWVAASDKTSPDDYRLFVEGGDARSRAVVELDVGSLPPLRRYERAVRATYDYGLDRLPQAIRRAHANLAAAALAEEAAIQIPNNAEVYSVESLAEKLETRAMDILEDRYL